MSSSAHIPVLLDEAIDGLAVTAGGHYVDCTLGRGGHSAAILERGGMVLALDADPEALQAVKLPIVAVHANFEQLTDVVKAHHFDPLDGVLFDLGLSSPQLDDAARGFAFSKDGPLDMRFDPGQRETAADIVMHATVDELARIFHEYGEEPQARKMARLVDDLRHKGAVRTTGQLAEAIAADAGGRGKIHPATRVFQGLRIAVNRELERLESGLSQAAALLRSGGRLVVISFHSLEDRIVKTFILRETRDCICPPRTPICICGHKATLKSITRKPLVPGNAELSRNPRARSAKMRVAERI